MTRVNLVVPDPWPVRHQTQTAELQDPAQCVISLALIGLLMTSGGIYDSQAYNRERYCITSYIWSPHVNKNPIQEG